MKKATTPPNLGGEGSAFKAFTPTPSTNKDNNVTATDTLITKFLDTRIVTAVNNVNRAILNRNAAIAVVEQNNGNASVMELLATMTELDIARDHLDMQYNAYISAFSSSESIRNLALERFKQAISTLPPLTTDDLSENQASIITEACTSENLSLLLRHYLEKQTQFNNEQADPASQLNIVSLRNRALIAMRIMIAKFYISDALTKEAYSKATKVFSTLDPNPSELEKVSAVQLVNAVVQFAQIQNNRIAHYINTNGSSTNALLISFSDEAKDRLSAALELRDETFKRWRHHNGIDIKVLHAIQTGEETSTESIHTERLQKALNEEFENHTMVAIERQQIQSAVSSEPKLAALKRLSLALRVELASASSVFKSLCRLAVRMTPSLDLDAQAELIQESLTAYTEAHAARIQTEEDLTPIIRTIQSSEMLPSVKQLMSVCEDTPYRIDQEPLLIGLRYSGYLPFHNAPSRTFSIQPTESTIGRHQERVVP